MSLQEIQRLKRSNQQLAQRLVQMTRACEAMQRIVASVSPGHPCLQVGFPVVQGPENIPELHAYEQCQQLKSAGLLGG
jgi:hypothetical protein